jgi:radical SAM protein with 4Fe4S-binding SPASM domain
MIPFSQLKTIQHDPLGPRIPLAGPLAVFIEFTNRCNFKCSFCPESLDEYASKAGGIHKLSRELFSKICDDLLELGTVKVARFYGLGETLLHREAPEMISEACFKGISERTELTTNGSMLTIYTSLKLVRSGLDYLRVSVYGTTKERMNEFTQSPISPERILENLVSFKAIRGLYDKPFIYVKMVTEDQDEAARFKAMFSVAADEINIEPMHNWTGEVRLTHILRPANKHVCPAPFYVLKINSDGIVNVCDADWTKATAVGDVKTETLKEIWNGVRMRKFRLMHLERRRGENAACQNCDYINQGFPDNLDELTSEVLR